MDWLRKNKKERDSIKGLAEEPQDNDENSTPVKIVRQLLKKLPEKERLILSLFYLEGHKIHEISTILNIPPGTVKSRIFYAREHLKKKYKEVNYENIK